MCLSSCNVVMGIAQTTWSVTYSVLSRCRFSGPSGSYFSPNIIKVFPVVSCPFQHNISVETNIKCNFSCLNISLISAMIKAFCPNKNLPSGGRWNMIPLSAPK
jgi:hypothetical protein